MEKTRFRYKGARMRGNNGSGNIKERDEWETPQKLFDKLNNQFKFDIDCCANDKNTKCEKWCDNFEQMFNKQGISSNTCWMNPPFSKARQMFEHFFKVVHKGVAIYRCDNMETKTWQEIIFNHASWIFIPDYRIAYEGLEGKGSRFPSALIGYNIEEPKQLKGTLLRCKK